MGTAPVHVPLAPARPSQAGPFRRQERDHVGDLFGPPQPPKRYPGHPLLADLRLRPAGEIRDAAHRLVLAVRVDEVGDDGVHQDVVRRQGLGQRLGEIQDRRIVQPDRNRGGPRLPGRRPVMSTIRPQRRARTGGMA